MRTLINEAVDAVDTFEAHAVVRQLAELLQELSQEDLREVHRISRQTNSMKLCKSLMNSNPMAVKRALSRKALVTTGTPSAMEMARKKPRCRAFRTAQALVQRDGQRCRL